MSKYKVKPSPKKEQLTVQDKKDEKQFFKVALVVTLIAILLVWLVFRNL